MKIHQFLFLSTELSSQSKVYPESYPGSPILLRPRFYFYRDAEANLRRISGRVVVGIEDGDIIGIVIGNRLRPACDEHGQMITVHIENNRHTKLTLRQSRELHFGHPIARTAQAELDQRQ